MEAAVETTVQEIKCDRAVPLHLVAAPGATPGNCLGVCPLLSSRKEGVRLTD